MKIVKIILVILLIAFVGIQFVPTKQNKSQDVPKTDFMMVNNVQNNIKTILQESCYNCHSNNTQYPWYNKIQPVAWFLENQIKEAKSELNFNDWDNYSDRRKKSKLKLIINQIKDNEMPLSSYTLMHREAILSEEDKELITGWLSRLRDNL